MALFNDKWVRIFDIPETSKHVKGFTLYKIVSIVYPKTCPDAVTKVTVWKRFNDFKKLHRDLKFRHKSMHIVDKYPNLASASFFKRFDTEVINQRKNSVLMFLEFIAIHPPLFKSEEFVKFFETSHSPQESLNSNINIIRAQLNLPNDPEVIYPNSEDEHDGHSDSDSMSTFSSTSASVIHVDDISILDRRSITSTTNLNQSLSISNISTISSPDLASKPIRTVTLDNISVHVYPTPPSTPEALLNAEVSATHYLIEAAELITKATECEFDKKYHDSFTMYKTGISILLEGVKGDTDSARRQMIRHKIEKYLLRAEKIYNLHLSPEITQIKNLCRTDLELTPYNIRRPLEDLFNYKILKIIGNGMVVLHKKEQNVFYLKVIQKGPQISNSVYLNIPKDVPYMVKLFQYYDSLNALFIVTQYINGGKLLDYVKQKSQNNVTPVLPMPLENETSRIIDKEFDDVSSESSECSYSDLITDYATAKKSEATKDQSPEESCSSFEPAKTSSDTEESSIVSHECENIPKDDASDKFTNEIKFKATTENNFRPFLRKISEKSFTEEFSSVNYIPMLADIIKWSSQLLLAIDKLHKIGVVISDLNPRNLLIDEKENLYLTFICNFREKGKLFFRKYENNFYCAPEVHGLYHVTFAADWWSFGAILFELLTGMPLKSVHPEGISNYTILKIPKYVLPEGKSILRQLLVYEPRDRLGCGLNGTEDIKSHPFFNNIDWIKRQVEAFKT